jgi:hypothetical protein
MCQPLDAGPRPIPRAGVCRVVPSAIDVSGRTVRARSRPAHRLAAPQHFDAVAQGSGNTSTCRVFG